MSLKHRDALGRFVVADGADKSGLVLGLIPTSPWRFGSTLTRDGRLGIQLLVGDEDSGISVKGGETVPLPRIILGAYRGGWRKGVAKFQRLLDSNSGEAGIDDLRKQVASAFRRATWQLGAGAEEKSPELDLWTMVQADWSRQDKLTETADSYAAATTRQIERARRLLADLRADQPAGFLVAQAHAPDPPAAPANRD